MNFMRIWFLIFVVISFGFTRAAFAMPVMTADMPMSEMTMVMDGTHASHHHDEAMRGSKAADTAPKAAQSHCLCVMCFPAMAAALVHPETRISGQMPIPLNVAFRLPSGPEPAFPPPRLG